MQKTNSPTRVVVADTQFLVTESIKVILKESNQGVVTKIVSNYDDLEYTLKQEPANVLITDFSLMNYSGVDDLKVLKKMFPSLAILLLTSKINKAELQSFVNAGVTSVLLKTTERDELLLAVDTISKGKKYFSGEVLDLFLEQKASKRQSPSFEDASLTASELEIVRLISQGLTTKAIADRRNISFHTVMTHRKNIFRKLGVTSASELLMYAVKNGMVDTLEYHI